MNNKLDMEGHLPSGGGGQPAPEGNYLESEHFCLRTGTKYTISKNLHAL